VSAQVFYDACVWPEGKVYVAAARPLEVLSYGDSPKQARQNLQEAVKLFLSVIKDEGTLDEVLIEAGYSKTAAGWEAPAVSTRRMASSLPV